MELGPGMARHGHLLRNFHFLGDDIAEIERPLQAFAFVIVVGEEWSVDYLIVSPVQFRPISEGIESGRANGEAVA